MPRFTPATEAALLAAGWFEGRTVPDEMMNDWLVINWFPSIVAPHGYSAISPAAWRVLNEFGGLAIPHADNYHGGHPLILNPLLVPDCGDFAGGLKRYSWELGVELFPLGMMRYDIVLDGPGPITFLNAVAIGGDGRIFSLRPAHHCLLGNSVEEALENFVAGKVAEVLEYDDLEYLEIHRMKEIGWEIEERIEARELQLMNGEWPTQPTTLDNDRSTGYFAISDWDAGAERVRRAFGIAQHCTFLGPPNRKTLVPTDKIRAIRTLPEEDDGSDYSYHTSLGDGLILQLHYSVCRRYFTVIETTHDTDASVALMWDDTFRVSGDGDSKLSLLLAKGLFHLGFLTPELEERLELNISNHQKMEWQLEFEASA